MKKNKIFQDSTQGYISVPEKYVSELIDSAEMQRLKDVSQTGLRAVYSGATHDRFSHSLGVFHVGCRIYENFIENICITLQDKTDDLKKAEKLLKSWRKLFHIACLLHDIGHPAFSHTLEFLFNSPYICIDTDDGNGAEGIEIGEAEVNRFYKRYAETLSYRSNNCGKTYLKTRLIDEIKKKEAAAEFKKYHSHNNLEGFKPSPHEMMGAFLILTDNALRKRIQKAYGASLSNKQESYAFMARMITGMEYDPIVPGEFSFELSLRNCVIGLLNGKIDADSIDYLNRNSHFAGYATSKLDLTRLCDSFSAYFEEKKRIFTPCLKKSALSTLDSFTSARNFEPKWLYGHHKTVYYNDFLIKFLVKMCGQYVFAESQKNWEKAIIGCLENGDGEFYKSNDGGKIKELVFDYLNGPPASRKHYKDWNDYSDNRILSDKNENSAIVKFAGLHGVAAMPFIEFLQTNKIKTSFTRYGLLDFFIGLTDFYIEKVFKTLEEKRGDENAIGGVYGELKLVCDFIRRINDMFSRIRVSCTDYFLSPKVNVTLKTEGGGSYNFNSGTDTHFRKLFLDFGIKYPPGSAMPAEPAFANKDDNRRREYRHALFTAALEEFKTRKLRPSLWKTYEEYKIFINSLSRKYNIYAETIEEELKELILKGSIIDFEDVLANLKESESEIGKQNRDGKLKRYEHVYTNYPEKDYVKNESERAFDSVFGFLGKGLIIRFYNCKFKNFSRIPIQFDNDVYRYGDIVRMHIPDDFSFPYIYYCEKDAKADRREASDKLGEYLIRYIVNKISSRGEKMDDSSFNTGKIIRDSVHGDIFVPNRFLKIIDCKVFQRLHRIKQLATAEMIFPEAVHSRFAHSLGTFYITGLMMDHFCGILNELKIECKQTEKDAILAAALLHDLGHGPYSHAYEHIGETKKSHEEWTKEIIKEDPELAKVFEEEFGTGFAGKVISCLEKNSQNEGDFSLTGLFSELISSNLDADRMDYLMRDAYNTGVKFGVFDLQTLISSMELVEYNGKPEIALRSDAVPSIEQFMVGRYHMYSEVYYAPYKLALEKVLAKICERIDYNSTDKNGDLYKLFHNLADLRTYMKMDDYSFMNEIENISKNSDDVILNNLLGSLKNRGGFRRMRMSTDDAKEFIDNWIKIFPEAKRIKYGVLSVGEDFKAYEADDKEILLVSNNGTVKKFSEASRLYDASKGSKKLWHTLTGYIYFNEEILRCELAELNEGFDADKIIKELKMLFDKYDANKHTEIENKYDCSLESIEAAKDVKTVFANPVLKGFICEGKAESRVQTDTYYDTKDFLLAQRKYSLRHRSSGTDNIFTVKKSAARAGDNKQAQFIRSEFEEKRESSDIGGAQDLFDEHLASDLISGTGERIGLGDLQPVVNIVNNRTSYTVRDEDGKSGFRCEVSLDEISYRDLNGNEETDYQVEIELKCKYPYRLRMNEFAERFCEVVGISGNSRAKESKYLKALTSLKLI